MARVYVRDSKGRFAKVPGSRPKLSTGGPRIVRTAAGEGRYNRRIGFETNSKIQIASPEAGRGKLAFGGKSVSASKVTKPKGVTLTALTGRKPTVAEFAGGAPSSSERTPTMAEFMRRNEREPQPTFGEFMRRSRKPAKAKAAKPRQAHTQEETDRAIRDAYYKRGGEPGKYVGFWEIREELGDEFTREEIDTSLRAMARGDRPEVSVSPIHATHTIKPFQRDAAVTTRGGEEVHILQFLGPAAKKAAAPKKATRGKLSAADKSEAARRKYEALRNDRGSLAAAPARPSKSTINMDSPPPQRKAAKKVQRGAQAGRFAAIRDSVTDDGYTGQPDRTSLPADLQAGDTPTERKVQQAIVSLLQYQKANTPKSSGQYEPYGGSFSVQLSPGQVTTIAALREESGLSRAQFDQVIQEMAGKGLIELRGEAAQLSLTDSERNSAVSWGNQPKYLVSLRTKADRRWSA